MNSTGHEWIRKEWFAAWHGSEKEDWPAKFKSFTSIIQEVEKDESFVVKLKLKPKDNSYPVMAMNRDGDYINSEGYIVDDGIPVEGFITAKESEDFREVEASNKVVTAADAASIIAKYTIMTLTPNDEEEDEDEG